MLCSRKAEKAQGQINIREAFTLWDLLNSKYMAVERVQIWENFAHDPDLKFFLKAQIKTLETNITILEGEMKRYSVPLPKKPGKITLTISETEVLDDDYMYRILINAFQGAALLHAKSFKECTVCDKIRQLFSKLLKEEINIIDRFTKVGKLKGWLNPAPRYS